VWSVAWAAIGVYCFGLLVLNSVLLLCVHTAIRTKRPTPLSSATTFLYRDYKHTSAASYLWEVAEVIRAPTKRRDLHW
jgi:hypothetical protein